MQVLGLLPKHVNKDKKGSRIKKNDKNTKVKQYISTTTTTTTQKKHPRSRVKKNSAVDDILDEQASKIRDWHSAMLKVFKRASQNRKVLENEQLDEDVLTFRNTNNKNAKNDNSFLGFHGEFRSIVFYLVFKHNKSVA